MRLGEGAQGPRRRTALNQLTIRVGEVLEHNLRMEEDHLPAHKLRMGEVERHLAHRLRMAVVGHHLAHKLRMAMGGHLLDPKPRTVVVGRHRGQM